MTQFITRTSDYDLSTSQFEREARERKIVTGDTAIHEGGGKRIMGENERIARGRETENREGARGDHRRD